MAFFRGGCFCFSFSLGERFLVGDLAASEGPVPDLFRLLEWEEEAPDELLLLSVACFVVEAFAVEDLLVEDLVLEVLVVEEAPVAV